MCNVIYDFFKVLDSRFGPNNLKLGFHTSSQLIFNDFENFVI